jgi:hypothetical protein
MGNPYVNLPSSSSGARLVQAHAAWLREMQQWQIAAWHHAALHFVQLLSLSRAQPSPPHPATVAERMASRSMWVVAGGRA